MAEDSGGEKTLPASPTKIQKSREEGNVAKSQDLSSAWSLMIALAAMWYLGPELFYRMIDATRFYFSNFASMEMSADTLHALGLDIFTRLAKMLLPFGIVMMIAGLALNVLQVGFLFSPKALQPKFNRLNPLSGLKKFFSGRSAFELLKSILKLTIVTLIVYYSVRNRWPELVATMHLFPDTMTIVVAKLIALVWFRAVLAMLVLGVLDFGFQRWQYGRDLMMTVQEAKEEMKQLEGDPRIKQRIRQIQRQMAMKRMMAEVPEADVIITNPIRFAVALRYDPKTMDAPVVIAKGARLLAQRIREIAEEHDVPIVEKPELARALFKSIDVGQPVPEDLFRAVAEVLAFVFKIDRREEKRRERTAMSAAPAHG
jgi:flagellar biosynthetic protein FlhB